MLPQISPIIFFEYAAADGIPVSRQECVAVVRIRLPVVGVDQLRLSCLLSEGAETASRERILRVFDEPFCRKIRRIGVGYEIAVRLKAFRVEILYKQDIIKEVRVDRPVLSALAGKISSPIEP